MPTKVAKAHSYTIPTLRELVDAGAHFGHRRSRSHPKARQFVYTIHDRVLVLNLEHTQSKLIEALKAVEALAAEGKRFLFVGTKAQAAEAVKNAATAAGMPYVNQRWMGGTMTNFETIRRNLDKLARLEQLEASEEFTEFTKKERVDILRQKEKLTKNFGGIATMNRLPDALIVVDLDQENIAVAEATRLGIPVIGIVDTNVDPAKATYPIPANDDSRRTIEMIVNLLAEAIVEGVKQVPVAEVEKLEDRSQKLAATKSTPAIAGTIQDSGPEGIGETKAERMASVTDSTESQEAGVMSQDSESATELTDEKTTVKKKTGTKTTKFSSKSRTATKS